MWEKIKSVKIPPIIGIVIAILGIVIGSTLSISGRKEIKPRYAVSEPELLAEVTADAPSLKILWDEEEIENVYLIKIAIWNAGREFIDNERISDTNPVRVVYPNDMEILFWKFTTHSRDDLRLLGKKEEIEGEETIVVSIEGDDSLEHNDGGIIQILYSGEETQEFNVIGKIKGSAEGFVQVTWDNIHWLDNIVRYSLILIVFLLPSYIYERKLKSKVKNKIIDTILSFLILLIIFPVAYYFLEKLPTLGGLSWVN